MLSVNKFEDVGGVIPNCCAAFRSTSRISISSINSPCGCSICSRRACASATFCSVLRIVRVREAVSSCVRVIPVISRIIRTVSFISSVVTEAGRTRLFSISGAYSRTFWALSSVTNNVCSSTTRVNVRVWRESTMHGRVEIHFRRLETYGAVTQIPVKDHRHAKLPAYFFIGAPRRAAIIEIPSSRLGIEARQAGQPRASFRRNFDGIGSQFRQTLTRHRRSSDRF